VRTVASLLRMTPPCPGHESLKRAWNLVEVGWKKHYDWSKGEGREDEPVAAKEDVRGVADSFIRMAKVGITLIDYRRMRNACDPFLLL
jgi:hypothetical protein